MHQYIHMCVCTSFFFNCKSIWWLSLAPQTKIPGSAPSISYEHTSQRSYTLFFFSKKKEKNYTLFFIGPNIPGGSCSLSVQVIPLSYDRFMHPLHLKFNKQTVSRSMQKMAVITIKFTFLQGAKKSRA